VAPPQPFQFPLPDPPAELADFDAVRKDLNDLMDSKPNGEFVRLAMQSANTYRCTDYLGGCNGARIRFSPGKDWKTNAGLDKTLSMLEPIKNKYGEGLSWVRKLFFKHDMEADTV
jgi:catalase-peroxidase